MRDADFLERLAFYLVVEAQVKRYRGFTSVEDKLGATHPSGLLFGPGNHSPTYSEPLEIRCDRELTHSNYARLRTRQDEAAYATTPDKRPDMNVRRFRLKLGLFKVQAEGPTEHLAAQLDAGELILRTMTHFADGDRVG